MNSKRKTLIYLGIAVLVIGLGILAFMLPNKEKAGIIQSTEGVSVSEETQVQKAGNELAQYVPDSTSSIPLIVNTYYDLTLFYGSGSETIFDKAGVTYDEFFYPFFGRNVSDYVDDIVPPEYEAFKSAFVLENSPASTFDFPWRTGAGIDGKFVGIKNLDASTVIAYGSYSDQDYQGAADGCKGETMIVDAFTFKQTDNGWKISDIKKSIDSWPTAESVPGHSECREINQDKIEKYKI